MNQTRTKALDIAADLFQRYGFQGFSFQHVADRLKIKKPSLYDHFASKEDLGNDLIQLYIERFKIWSGHQESRSVTAPKKIEAWFDIYFRFLSDHRKLCPTSTLTAELNNIPNSMKKNLHELVDIQKNWIRRVIKEGQEHREITREKDHTDLTDLIVSLGLGAQMLGRLQDDPSYVRHIKRLALEILQGDPYGF